MKKKETSMPGVQKKDPKTLVIGFLIITIIIILAYTFGNITGANVNEQTMLEVNPKVVTAGDLIKISIKPGTDGINRIYRICEAENDMCRVRYSFKCGEYKCKQIHSVEYKTSSSWDGIYYIKIFDYTNERWEKAYFTVLNDQI
ncbi:MAG: hypothetical protein PHE43_01005 [Candidatus Nanoarchaeia archaeon]|nr:hypothetical protein [Candidatus Nanoarchaeia archaeon]